MVIDQSQRLWIESDVEIDDNYYFQVSSRYVDVSEINAELLRACETFYESELINEYDTSLKYSWEWYTNGNVVEFINNEDVYIFDRDTGKVLTCDDLFKPGYKDHMEFSKYQLDRDYDKIDYSKIAMFFYFIKSDGKIVVSEYFSIDESWLDERYTDIAFEINN
jgi:hypothetical protein